MVVSQTRETCADLKRMPTGKPSASFWCAVPPVSVDSSYLVSKPPGKLAVFTKKSMISCGPSISSGLRDIIADHSLS
ncbi:hypothetical protein D3C74_427250 [compost metagenome]